MIKQFCCIVETYLVQEVAVDDVVTALYQRNQNLLHETAPPTQLLLNVTFPQVSSTSSF